MKSSNERGSALAQKLTCPPEPAESLSAAKQIKATPHCCADDASLPGRERPQRRTETAAPRSLCGFHMDDQPETAVSSQVRRQYQPVRRVPLDQLPIPKRCREAKEPREDLWSPASTFDSARPDPRAPSCVRYQPCWVAPHV